MPVVVVVVDVQRDLLRAACGRSHTRRPGAEQLVVVRDRDPEGAPEMRVAVFDLATLAVDASVRVQVFLVLLLPPLRRRR